LARKKIPTKAKPPAVVVRGSRISGRGCFAGHRFEAGERVIEYAGERIPQAEGHRRYADKSYTFLFELDSRTFIDGEVGGNEARFINHSCRPNCKAVGERGRIVIRALRRIRSGEELTFDYALPRDASLGAAEDELYPCRCGARFCRGTILEPAQVRRPTGRAPRGSRLNSRRSRKRV
jgi:uncharacterized protein